MPYATSQDLIDRLGTREATMLSDRSNTGVPDATVLTRALGEAESVINGYIGRRYALPLTTSAGQAAATPETIKRLAIDIARYLLSGTEVMESEAVRNRYKDAIRLLEQMADGKVMLGDLALAGAGGPAPVGGSFAARTGSKTFGMTGVL